MNILHADPPQPNRGLREWWSYMNVAGIAAGKLTHHLACGIFEVRLQKHASCHPVSWDVTSAGDDALKRASGEDPGCSSVHHCATWEKSGISMSLQRCSMMFHLQLTTLMEHLLETTRCYHRIFPAHFYQDETDETLIFSPCKTCICKEIPSGTPLILGHLY